jgi:hypothetical protein
MLFPSLNHALVIPGLIMLAFSSLNLLRYLRWSRTTGSIVQRETLPGEVIGDKIVVNYQVYGNKYVSDLDQTFCLVRALVCA